MYDAVRRRDPSFEGVFVVAVRTTGIFCRPGCPAKAPLRKNVEFFASPSAALHAGYRACKRCRPMEPSSTSVAPEAWVRELADRVDRDPRERLDAAGLRALGIEPARASRQFKRHFGMTFQAYRRARRMGTALQGLRAGSPVSAAALGSGFNSESGFRDAFAKLFGAPPGRARSHARMAGEPADVGPGPLTARWLDSPLGPLLAVAGDEGVCLLEFVDRRALATQIAVLRRRFGRAVVPESTRQPHPLLERLAGELAEYFAGRCLCFSVPLLAPGTPFQERVWAALRTIPAGQTRSYLQIARAIGRPTATRAVARANGDNRLAILIPCHRVIGADGSPTGYGGGIWRKQRLLELERGADQGGLFAGRPAPLAAV